MKKILHPNKYSVTKEPTINLRKHIVTSFDEIRYHDMISIIKPLMQIINQ